MCVGIPLQLSVNFTMEWQSVSRKVSVLNKQKFSKRSKFFSSPDSPSHHPPLWNEKAELLSLKVYTFRLHYIVLFPNHVINQNTSTYMFAEICRLTINVIPAKQSEFVENMKGGALLSLPLSFTDLTMIPIYCWADWVFQFLWPNRDSNPWPSAS